MKKVITIVVVILLAGGYFYWNKFYKKRKKTIKRPSSIEEIQRKRGIPVKVYIAKRKDVNLYLTFIGTVEPKKEISIVAKERDTIKEVYVDVGDHVRKGQKLIKIDRSTLNVQIAAMRAKLIKAQRDLERLKKLLKKGAVSKSDVENARVNYETIRSQYIVLKNQLSERILVSPIDGIVSYRNAQPGEVASISSPLLKIISTKSNKIKVEVPESYITEIKRGQAVEISIDSSPMKIYRGKVSVVYPIANPSKLFTIKINIESQKAPLMAGMLTRVRILVSRRKNILMVPSNSVFQKDSKKFVYIAKNGRAEKRYIIIGKAYEDFIEVKRGIEVGEKVINTGGYYLYDGARILISK